jgi:glycosyltransferase involved in cell wall biosynthesis
MSLIFINHPLETFTPTASGALATIIWECCRVAEKQGVRPRVITRSSPIARFDWPETTVLEYPPVPTQGPMLNAYRLQRKLTGWNHLRHRAYAVRVANAVRVLPELPLVLINDPEMTIFLRKRFPGRTIVHWFENQQECRPRVQKEYATAASVTLGVSDFTSRWVSGYYGVKSVPTLYNGVDAEQFKPAGASPEAPVVNFVGRTGIEKAPDLLLKAAIETANVTTNFSLQMVGSNHWDRFELDDYQRTLNALSAELEGKGIPIRRPGHVGRKDLPAEFRKATIHVVPSRWDEPFGLTTVEGMASGLAVIGSRTGGTPEVIGDAGILFENESTASLAQALTSLITDAGMAASLGRSARERALEFSWERTWREMCTHAGVRSSSSAG